MTIPESARVLAGFLTLGLALAPAEPAHAQDRTTRVYENRLTPIASPRPILANHPEFIEPVREVARFEAPAIVQDEGADLSVRAWRFSYNARGIIETPNRLRAADTAVIMVHPWGIDDGQGWKSPEPAGVCDFCTPVKNGLAARHTREVVDPFLKSLRGKAAFVMYSLPGPADPIRKRAYRSFNHTPTAEERAQGMKDLKEKLASIPYTGEPLPTSLTLSTDRPVIDYFLQFRGLDPGPRYNGPDFWKMPIPITTDVDAHPDDVVVFDAEGYAPLRDFLAKHGVRHVLLTGYATDMCYRKTTAGFENLSKDFDVFLVGDASLATFPGNDSPRFATNAALSFAALDQLVTQISWIRLDSADKPEAKAAGVKP